MKKNIFFIAVLLLSSGFLAKAQESTVIEASAVITNASAHSFPDGQIDLTVENGTAPYQFAWSNGLVSEDIFNLFEGSYSVLITDSEGNTGQHTFVVGVENDTVYIDTSGTYAWVVAYVTNESSLNANDGAIDIVSVHDMEGPYQFNWYKDLWINIGNSEDLSGISAGTYQLTIIDNNNNSADFEFEVGLENDPIDQPPCYGFSALSFNTHVDETTTGAINLEVFSGVPPYTYLWSNGATTQDIDDLTTGLYTVEIADNSGCSFTYTTYIYESVEDSSILNNPVGVFETGTPIDTCLGEIDNVFIGQYILTENSVIISWYITENNNMIAIFEQEYTVDFSVQGLYQFILEINCEETRGQKAFNDKIYIDPEIITQMYLREKQEFKVYPVPAKGHVNIVSGNNVKGFVNYQIINVNGQIVMENKRMQKKQSDVITLNTSGLPKGVYLLRLVKNDKIIKTQAFVK